MFNKSEEQLDAEIAAAYPVRHQQNPSSQQLLNQQVDYLPFDPFLLAGNPELLNKLLSVKAEVNSYLVAERAARLNDARSRHDELALAFQDHQSKMKAADNRVFEAQRHLAYCQGELENARKHHSNASFEYSKKNPIMLTFAAQEAEKAKIASLQKRVNELAAKESNALAELQRISAERDNVAVEHNEAGARLKDNASQFATEGKKPIGSLGLSS